MHTNVEAADKWKMAIFKYIKKTTILIFKEIDKMFINDYIISILA